MHAALLPAALLSADFRFIVANQALAALVQSTSAQLRRKTLLDVVGAGDEEAARSVANSLSQLGEGATTQGEVRIGQRYALLIARRSGTSREPRYVINVVDLTEVSPSQTERAELLEKVERAAQEWRGTFDAVEMPIVIVGRDLAVARMNRAARMLAGKTYEEVVGVSLRQLPPAEPWLSMADLAATSQQSRGPGARQVRDSSGRTLDLLAMLFNAAEPADDRVIVIVWDVSALVDLQSRLEQQRQMATMGALVAGVAHEVRNPLFAISATVDALEQIAGADLGEYFEVLREEIDRMTRLMQELLAYGRPTTPVFSDLAVQEIVEAAARACSAAAGRQHVDIAVHSLDGLMISADRDRMIRAVENLIMNAIQHSPQGGSVTVEASRRREARSEAVTIAVRDQGRGIAEGDLPRIFDPFFSRRKGGTGLGLALVQQIVTEHGGEVRAANVQGGGAEVVVTIPAKRSHAT